MWCSLQSQLKELRLRSGEAIASLFCLGHVPEMGIAGVLGERERPRFTM